MNFQFNHFFAHTSLCAQATGTLSKNAPIRHIANLNYVNAPQKQVQKLPAGTLTGQRLQRNRTRRHNAKGVLLAKTMPRKVSQKCSCDNPSRVFVLKREDFAQDACSTHVHPTPTQLSRSCAQHMFTRPQRT